MNLLLLASGPGQKLQEAVSGEIQAIFLLAVIAGSVLFFIKRAFSLFIGFALFAMLVGVFIYSPELLQVMGTDAFQWLFGDLIR